MAHTVVLKIDYAVDMVPAKFSGKANQTAYSPVFSFTINNNQLIDIRAALQDFPGLFSDDAKNLCIRKFLP